MKVEKTFVIKGKPETEWLLMDAKGQNLGRLATRIAELLMGKHKPTFTPGVEMGDQVIVINASLLEFTNKRLETKMYYRHSGYPSGLTETSLKKQLATHPDRVVRAAVWGMLPHNKIGRKLIKNLKIYSGNEHPHEAQIPKLVE
jgi:large subunit ribosomal protein L13